jgi:hypothetical protein
VDSSQEEADPELAGLALSGSEQGSATNRQLGGEPVPACQVCGRPGTSAELVRWMMDRRDGRISWTCPSCAAANIRALEAKLEPEWW